MEHSRPRFDALDALAPGTTWEVTGFAEVSRDFHSDVARIQTIFREVGVVRPRRCVVNLPLGEVSCFAPGAQWRDGYFVGNSDYQRVEIEIEEPEDDLELLSRFWTAEVLSRRACPDEAVTGLARSRVSRHRIVDSSRQLRCGHALLLCSEIYRRVFGVATDFSKGVFDGRILADQDIAQRLKLGPNPSIRLPNYLSDESAPLLAYYILNPKMQEAAQFLVTQYMNDYWRYDGAAPLSMYLPVEYPARITVLGKRYRTVGGENIFMIKRLLSIRTASALPDTFNIERDSPVPIPSASQDGLSSESDSGTDRKEEKSKRTPPRETANNVSDGEPANDDLYQGLMEIDTFVFDSLNDVKCNPVYERIEARSRPKAAINESHGIENDGQNHLDTNEESRLTTAPGRSDGPHRLLNMAPAGYVELPKPCEFGYALKVLEFLQRYHAISVRFLAVSKSTVDGPHGPINLFPAKFHGNTFYWAIMDRAHGHFRQCLIVELRKGDRCLYLFEAQLRANENRCPRIFGNANMAPANDALGPLLHAMMLSEARSVAQLLDEYDGPRLPSIVRQKIAGLVETRFEHAQRRGGPRRIAERMAALFDADEISNGVIIGRSTCEEQTSAISGNAD